jgi:hypothetical protein
MSINAKRYLTFWSYITLALVTPIIFINDKYPLFKAATGDSKMSFMGLFCALIVFVVFKKNLSEFAKTLDESPIKTIMLNGGIPTALIIFWLFLDWFQYEIPNLQSILLWSGISNFASLVPMGFHKYYLAKVNETKENAKEKKKFINIGLLGGNKL